MLGCVCGRFVLFSWFSTTPRAALVDWSILASREDAEELVLGTDVEDEFQHRKAAQARVATRDASRRDREHAVLQGEVAAANTDAAAAHGGTAGGGGTAADRSDAAANRDNEAGEPEEEAGSDGEEGGRRARIPS
ncbi:hypothetical protein T484DRAFT_1917058, partial [Baffinella frigidus]